MKLFLMMCYLVYAICDDVPSKCVVSCEPEDEFEGDMTTPEWDTFMGALENFTFVQRSKQCTVKVDEVVIFNDTNQIWDWRFQLYNEISEGGYNHLNDCLCQYSANSTDRNCKSLEFRSCMQDARNKTVQVIYDWNAEIDKKLEMLAKNC